MFEIYLDVASESMTVAEMTLLLGAVPDGGNEKGERRHPGVPPAMYARWRRNVFGEDSALRPEDAESIVLGWGRSFAEALGELSRRRGAHVSLNIVQQIWNVDSENDEAAQERGIVFGVEMMSWFGVARASLNVDQYVLHECVEVE